MTINVVLNCCSETLDVRREKSKSKKKKKKKKLNKIKNTLLEDKVQFWLKKNESELVYKTFLERLMARPCP